ncbi:DNA internalization-related competence protein ComEC/Rec2 [Paraglaciecola aestuariivivens]
MDNKLIGFIAGALTSLLWTSLPSVSITLFLFLLACYLIRLQLIFAFPILGIVWMASVGHWQGAMQLSSSQTSQPIHILGQVSSIVTSKNNIRFNFDVQCINQECFKLSKTFRLSWLTPHAPVKQGQKWALQVKVKPPHGLANEGGFHYQQWLFSQQIVATGYVKNHIQNQLISNQPTLRQSLVDQLLTFKLENKAWVAALAFGYRGLLTQQDWSLVQKTGVAHLIAISGLHLALVASFSYFIVAWLVAAVVSRMASWPQVNLHNWALVISLGCTFLYSAIAGFGLPTLRAWLMLALFVGCFIFHQSIRPKRIFLLGLASFILLFPTSIYGLSFWLSFCAVFFIGFIFWRWPVPKAGFSMLTALMGMLKLQLGLSLLMFPLIAWQFGYISWLAPMINLVAVPVVTLLLVPLCLSAVVVLCLDPNWAQPIFALADALLGYGLEFLSFGLTLDWAYFDLPSFPVHYWLFLFVFLLLGFLPFLFVAKFYLVLLLVPFVTSALFNSSTTWQIYVLDVGQGVSVVIIKNNRAIVYDVGAYYPSGFNMAEAVLLPFLQAKGIQQIDMLFLSHSDNDHAGSAKTLLEHMPVVHQLTNQTSCQQGLALDWQGLSIQGLWPDEPAFYSSNNGSCVLRVADSHHSLLLPGDIDKSIEAKLINLHANKLTADILLAPHHGSNTSSSLAFIQQVDPDFVVFSQGYMNRWQFPRDEVVQRYRLTKQLNQLFTTSHSGQVSFAIEFNSPKPIQVTTFRQQIHPYWYAN